MGFGVAEVTALAQATPPDGLRLRALDAGARGVLGGARGGLLPLPRGVDRLVLGLRPDGELARRLLGLGARRADRTRPTGRRMKPDAYHGITRDLPPWRPSEAGVPLGTAGVLRLPVDHEGAQIVALACPPLMARRSESGADDVDLMPGVGGDESVGIDRTALEPMRAGEAITLSQVWLDGRSQEALRGGRRRGHDPRDQGRLTLLTGFGEVDF
jgi:hypothetical protein